MAKGKRAAALFEVINPGQPLHRPLRKRSSWIGGVLKSTTAQFASAGAAIRTTALARPATPKPPKTPNLDITADPERQLLNFKLTYSTAIVAGFAVLVALGLAYVVGLKVNHRLTAATSSPSTAELRARGADPEVLNVNDRPSPNAELLTSPPMAAAQMPDPATDGTAENKSPTTAPSATDRVIGRQYVIVQTFADETAARAAKAFLEKNKISCTIENGLSSWAPKTKWCLVGTSGFDHLRGNVEFEHYEANIERLGRAFAESNKGHPFEPHAYRWKGSAS